MWVAVSFGIFIYLFPYKQAAKEGLVDIDWH